MGNSRQTIGFVIGDLEHGGAQGQLSMLVRAMSERYIPQVYVASTRSHPWRRIITDAGIDVVEFKRTSKLDPVFALALARTMRKGGVDIVHGFLDPSNGYATIAATLNRKPLVLSLQSDRLSFSALHNFMLTRCYRRADAVTVNSKAGEAFLLRKARVEAARLSAVRNWIETHPQPPPARNGRALVGFVGRLVELKRADLLIEAFRHVKSSRPDSRLILIGDGPERGQLEAHARRFQLTESTEFAGAVSDVRERLREFDCLAIPSEYEGLPNVAVEALAEGIPIVARPVGDLPELVIPGRTGMLVPDDNPRSLGDAIVSVIADGELRKRARSEGPALVRENFSIERAVESFHSIYQALSGR